MTDQGGASFATHPAVSAWRHRDASDGFEVLRIAASGAGLRLQGTTAAVEDGQAWVVDYDIEIDAHWLTRAAQVDVRSDLGPRSVRLTADGLGHWLVDGEVAPWLDGCLDVDVEASAATNAMPVHRLALTSGRVGRRRRRPTSVPPTRRSSGWSRPTYDSLMMVIASATTTRPRGSTTKGS